MSEGLAIALAIAVVGMGLIFGVILVLWGFMALLVRSTPGKGHDAGQKEYVAEDEMSLKRQAALAAVAVALARQQATDGPQPFPVPPPSLVSTWQAVRRAHQFGQQRGVR